MGECGADPGILPRGVESSPGIPVTEMTRTTLVRDLEVSVSEGDEADTSIILHLHPYSEDMDDLQPGQDQAALNGKLAKVGLKLTTGKVGSFDLLTSACFPVGILHN